MSKVESAHLRFTTLAAADSVRTKADAIIAEIDEQSFPDEHTSELMAIHNEMILEATGNDPHWMEFDDN